MPHQEKVLNQTKDFNRVAYYLDMGLGKTFVGAEKVWELNNDVNLVICQKSKIDDWVQHFKDHYPDYEVFDLTHKSQAITFRNRIDTKSIYHRDVQIIGVINYDLTFRRDWMLKINEFTMMLDESSLITNENAKRSKFILKMKPESVVLLSGTPTAGKYERLWSQVQLLGWNINKKTFWNSYVDTKWVENGDGFKQEVIVGYKNVEHLKKKLAQYGAVFMKTSEVLDLPEQIEQKIMFKVTKEYKFFIKNSYLLIDDDTELVGDNNLTKTLYARQLCGQYHKEKLEGFRDLVQSTEDRLIVFYNFTAEYEAMKAIAEELERPVSVVRGGEDDRTAYEESDNSITFIQYQAGAMGGNFQKANKVIYFTLPLGKGSCDLWEQSKKRIHRIGQNNTCFYYYLLVKGSIEEKNLSLDWGVGDLDFKPLDCKMPEEQQEFVYYLCSGYNLDFTLVMALIQHESSFDPNVISNTNDYGYMQINAINHDWLTETIGVTDYTDPYQNIRAGVFVLRKLFERYQDTDMVLMAYNMGENGASRLWEKGIFETDYTQSILTIQEQFNDQLEGD